MFRKVLALALIALAVVVVDADADCDESSFLASASRSDQQYTDSLQLVSGRIKESMKGFESTSS